MNEILNKIFEIAVGVQSLIECHIDDKIDTSVNSSGDNQVPLDILSDKFIEDKLKELKDIKLLISEEKEGTVEVNKNGKYSIAYDPLDGSSLVGVNLSIGTIFGIYENDFKGKDLVSAGYIVYGPRLEVVFATESGVKYFRRIKGEFVEIKMKHLKESHKIISAGALNSKWLDYHRKIVNSFYSEGYKLRHSGGMVPDIHHLFLKGGGLFSYPEIEGRPKGKLRKLFEVFPFAFIAEKLGGGAIDDSGMRILDAGYDGIHDSTPCYIGSNYEISKIKEFLRNK